jgi:hypothetical protein
VEQVVVPEGELRRAPEWGEQQAMVDEWTRRTGSRGSTLSGRVGAQSTSQAFSVGRSGDNGGGSNESKNGGELHCDLEGRESDEDKDGKEGRVSHWWSKEGDL